MFAGGRISGAGKSASLAKLAGALGLQADGEIKPGEMAKKYSQQAYGAHFAEVAVDMDSGEIRLCRMLGVFAAGRILNMKTATSQALGDMIWGVGSALHEEAIIDPRFGFFVNHDLAEYPVPVHADIPAIEAIFLPEVDDKTNPLQIKGVGELGISGAGAALANAVFNACGVRIRSCPLMLDKILAALPAVACQGAASAFLAALPSPRARLRWRSGKPSAWALDTLDNMNEPRFPAPMPKPGFFIQSIIIQGFGLDGMGVKSYGFNSNFVGHHDGRHWQRLAGGAAQLWRAGTLHPAYAQPGRWCAAGNGLHASAARGV